MRALPGYECLADEDLPPEVQVEIPTLLGTYLRYGARVCGPPAIDRFFGTIDFLTLLDVAAAPRRVFMAFASRLEKTRH